ncbi:MAG: VTT domain-containing protein [Gammaproteobacteria bacterium]|nr:VTT domain-containing protein [Gammaproteobacteria bacterium]
MVPFLAFLEAFVGIGLFISGAILLSVCTVLYIEQLASIQQMVMLAFCGACLSDHYGYYIGRFLGPKFDRTNFVIKRASVFKKAEQNILKYGVSAIFVGRFLTPIRSLVPLLVGVSGMSRIKFTVNNFFACALWSTCLGLLVYGIDKLIGF